MNPEEELRFLILGAQREGNRVFASLLAPLNLTPAQAEVLRCLADMGPVSLNALGRRLVCESGSPSRLVSTVVDRGWVIRAEDPQDRRLVALRLTDEGRRLAGAVRGAERQLHDWIGEGLGRADIKQMTRALRSFLDGTAAGSAIAERRTAGSVKTRRRRAKASSRG